MDFSYTDVFMKVHLLIALIKIHTSHMYFVCSTTDWLNQLFCNYKTGLNRFNSIEDDMHVRKNITKLKEKIIYR